MSNQKPLIEGLTKSVA